VAEKQKIQKEDTAKKEVKLINRNVVIFAFFLFISFIFWYLNALGKEIEAEIRYSVSYVNPPKERTIAEAKPESLTFVLKGSGYSILRLKLKRNATPVVIDISRTSYKRVPGSRDLNYFIITSGLSNNLTTILKSEFEIESIKPDTLFFTLNKIAVVPVPVNMDN